MHDTTPPVINDTFAEINLNALKENFFKVREEASSGLSSIRKICSIVKANAYGHGMFEVSRALAEAGTDFLGTANYSESISLRAYLAGTAHKDIPIICLGLLTEEEKFFKQIAANDIEVTVSDYAIAELLNNFASGINKTITVHVKVDTGMNRIGFPADEAYEAVKKLSSLKNLKLKGIFSHFATSELPESRFAKKQLQIFKEIVSRIENEITKFELRHIQNSGGILNFKDEYFNMVRPGIVLYGYYPDRKTVKKDIGITPIMTLKSKVSLIKEVDKRKSISYGRKYYTKKKTKIASVPIGYGDGYSRLLSNKSQVVINNRLYAEVGTVCMDWIMVDIGEDDSVKVNDEVILLGKEYPAYNHSELIGTIPYEITCNISPRVQRIYVEK
jgi:alanine racemase